MVWCRLVPFGSFVVNFFCSVRSVQLLRLIWFVWFVCFGGFVVVGLLGHRFFVEPGNCVRIVYVCVCVGSLLNRDAGIRVLVGLSESTCLRIS